MSLIKTVVERRVASLVLVAAFAASTVGVVFATPEKWPKLPGTPETPGNPAPPQAYDPPTRPLTPIELDRNERAKKSTDANSKLKELLKAREKEAQAYEKSFEKLLNEFGPDASYATTRRFIFIYDASDEYVLWQSSLMESVATTFETFCAQERLSVAGLGEPMVVFIFSTKANYEAYLKKTASSDMQSEADDAPIAFYNRGTNRGAFFEITGGKVPKSDAKGKKSGGSEKQELERELERIALATLNSGDGAKKLAAIVHESVLQVAYNYGLFSPKGENPAWAAEGLAALFEPLYAQTKEGEWKLPDPKSKTIAFPISEARVKEFQSYAASTTDAQPVKKCVGLEKISSDEPCAAPVSWALFGYMRRYNSKALVKYLSDSAAIQPRLSYPTRERVLDFANYFGEDWDGTWLELRAFVDALELELKGVAPADARKQAREKRGLSEKPPIPGKKGAK